MSARGGRLGSGLYFSDQACKSGYYASPSSDGSAILFLAEVASGKSFPLTNDSRMAQGFTTPPEGHDSVHARGKSTPHFSGDKELTLTEGHTVKLSTGIPVDNVADSSFCQDEIVVYDERQVALRFVVRIRVH
eukprot:CAMPEP_0185751648 /NCGR_PEP_ID=MMETSP1174-20130828/10422_1 /TAXON_ID=35687 /ORGANISM="Dictyocha speculum, Strain CCMP1381" /LENGTH=132 /DNA_ID=CAMNT_0028428715 /DNA_START=19 /DNA_END=417 /DNA_ORIENTATION=+